MKCHVQSLSIRHVELFATPWTVAHQAPLSMWFSRQEYWSGLPFPSLGIFPTKRSNLHLLCLSCIAGGFFVCLAIREACNPYTDNVWSEFRNKIITSLETKFSFIPLNTSQKEAWWIFHPPCLIKSGHQLGFTFSFSSFGQKNNLLVKIYHNKNILQEVTCDLTWHSKARVCKTTGSSLKLMSQFPRQSLQSSCPHSMPSHICAWVTLSSPPFSFHFYLLLLFLSFEGHCSLASVWDFLTSTSDCVPFAHWNTVIQLIGQYSEYSITGYISLLMPLIVCWPSSCLA